MSELLAELRAVELLADMDDKMLEQIAALVHIQKLDQDDLLVSEGEAAADLYFLRSGSLVATVDDGGSTTEVGRLRAGDVIGESQLIAGGRRTATVSALESSVLLQLPAADLDRLMAEHEPLRAALEKVIHLRLHEAALRVALPRALGDDAELVDLLSDRASWVQLQRGEILWQQGAAADGWYLLVSGELSSMVKEHGVEREVGRVGRGEVFGEVALLSGEPRSASILALRESWVARFDSRLFEEEILAKNSALQALLRTLAGRLAARPLSRVNSTQVIAVMARDPGLDVDGFLALLGESLPGRGRVVNAQNLRDEGVVSDAERMPADHPGWLRFEGWVESQRQQMDYLLLVSSAEDDGWSRAVLDQADRALLLVDADASPQRSEIEISLFDSPASSQQAPLWLVLEHPAERVIPSGTAAWLNERQPAHHAHIRRGHSRDIARLARWLGGETLGLALSGGGARGFVHLGSAEAMFEAGCELDLVVGTSAGAMSASLLARDEAPALLCQRGQLAVASQGNPFVEFDLPLISLLRSRRLRDGLKQTFADMAIEDSWIPLRVVATNLTESRRIVFDRGPVWQRVFASSSPPGAMPPVQLGEHLLCDGGLVDNLPVSVLVEAGCKLKVASYVGSSSSLPAPKNGMPTSWMLLFDKILRRGRYRDVPTLLATLMQCISVPAAVQLEQARASADIFFQAELSAFPATDFTSSQAMFETGLSHAREVLETWKSSQG